MRARILAAASLVAALAVAVPSPAGAASSWTRWSPRPATYGVARTADVPIRMSDGVVLYADVLRPARADGTPAPGRFPVVLTQTPYNKNGALNFESDYLVRRGYVQVIVDVRGTGSSEGRWNSFGAREQRDSAELVRWVASPTRPWSNGRVGLHGTSYGAINQLFTAAHQQPSVKAAFPIVPMSDAYRDITASGGQIDTSFIPSWLGLVTALGLLPPTYSGSDPGRTLEVMNDHAEGAQSFQAQTVLDAMQGGSNAYDGAFYRTRSPIDVIDRVRIPTFIMGGWFDLFQRGEPLLYQRLRANGVPVRLVMGPWYHITAGNGLPADGVPPANELELRWFDHYVRGVADPGLANTPSVTYFRNGEGHYHFAPSWPPPGVGYRQLYLSGPAEPGSAGTLAAAPPAKQSPDTLPWQPLSGVCTRSTVQWTAGAGSGSLCESDDEFNDATGLAYDLALPRGLTVAGPIAVRLDVGTNGHDSLLAVRVEDVDPNGRATQLTAGWNTISLRALDRSMSTFAGGLMVRPYHPFTKTSELPVVDGKAYAVWIEIFPTSARFAPGHSLRISIQPSDAPHLSPTEPQLERSVGGVLSLYHDAAHDSEVILPVQG